MKGVRGAGGVLPWGPMAERGRLLRAVALGEEAQNPLVKPFSITYSGVARLESSLLVLQLAANNRARPWKDEVFRAGAAGDSNSRALCGTDPLVFLSLFSSPLYSSSVTGASRMNFPMDPTVVQGSWRSG